MTPPPDFPSSMVEHAGPIVRVRSLSSRLNRDVYLVEDRHGQIRVFKLHRNLTSKTIADFLDVRTRLSKGPTNGHLKPVLAFGGDHSTVWEELPPADDAENDVIAFDEYSPLHPQRSNSSSKDQSLELAVEVGFAACSALVVLAGMGLTHGDVKRTNILRINGRWVLGDFDTVCSNSVENPPTASTEGYVPPGGDDGGGRDCYALGKLMYELWTGCDRLEYPTMPSWLMKSRWNRVDRLLNDTICRLCSPLATRRLRDIEAIQRVLNALEHRDQLAIEQAETLVRSRRPQWKLPLVILGMVGIALVVWLYATTMRFELWDGQPVVFSSYRHPSGINNGYVRWGSNGIRNVWMLFNTHATLSKPLQQNEVLEFSLKKEVWRGHIGLYLSTTPFHALHDQLFSHRENFGGIDHLLFFHVDGDSLVAPTIFKDGKAVEFPFSNWKIALTNNTLATYTIQLKVMPNEYLWSVSAGGVHLAEGHYLRDPSKPEYLNIYTFDNTVCYLSDLKMAKRNSD